MASKMMDFENEMTEDQKKKKRLGDMGEDLSQSNTLLSADSKDPYKRVQADKKNPDKVFKFGKKTT